MKVHKISKLVLLFVFVVMVTVGCGSPSSDVSSKSSMTGEQFIEKINAAQSDVKNFAFTQDIKSTTSLYIEGREASFPSDITLTGVFDVENKRSYASSQFDSILGNQNFETYTVDGAVYQEVFGEWVKFSNEDLELAVGQDNDFDISEMQSISLDPEQRAEVQGNNKLRVYFDKQTIGSDIMESLGKRSPELIGKIDHNEAIKNAYMDYVVDEQFRLKEVDVKIEYVIGINSLKPEAREEAIAETGLEVGTNEILSKIETTVKIMFSDYNLQDPITVPEEVLSAKSFGE